MAKITLAFSLITAIFSWFNFKKATQRPINTMETQASFYDFKLNTLTGEEINFEKYKGKKVLIINTASKCGYTPQYKDWEQFHKKHGDKVVVLGFPCNQFGGQEPGTADEIHSFCEINYGVTFTLFEKVDVKGKNQSALYHWLTDPTLNGWNDKVPSWNFCKYLVNEKGELTHFFPSGVKPDSKEFLEAAGI